MWSISDDGRIDELVVFKASGEGYIPAGVLKMEGRGSRRQSRFAYAESYLKRCTSTSLDPIGLPLGRRWRPSNPDEVHLAFHDSGPDGWGKGILDMAFPALRLGMPEYLALGGMRRTGDLAFGCAPERPVTWRPADFPLIRLPEDDDDVEALMAAAKAVDDGEPSADHLALLVRASADVGGARPKARLRYKGADWIAKFPTWSDRFDDPRLEAVCLDVAEAAGIEVPDRALLTIRNRAFLLLRRFDRDVTGRPLAYLSAGTLLEEPSVNYNTTRTYADIAEVGRRIGVPGTAKEMFRRFLLNSYVHNTDDHLRNHAFLGDGGTWRLSPVFDVVPHPGVMRHVCAPAANFNPIWDPAAADGAYVGFGLDKPEASEIVETVTAAVMRIGDFMDAREVTPADRALILSSLRR